MSRCCSGSSPTRILHRFWGNFRVGGYSTGTENFRTERLDEYVGDCVNSTAFPATSAFIVTDSLDIRWSRFNERIAWSLPSSQSSQIVPLAFGS